MRKIKTIIVICIAAAISTIVISVLVSGYFKAKNDQILRSLEINDYKTTLEAVSINYGSAINLEAKKYGVESAYFKALCALECSGRKRIPPRFEKHIYRKLVNVKNGKSSNFENIKKSSLVHLSDGAMKNLASSWGPFQIMGYKTISMNCLIVDLRNQNAIKYGMQWIMKEYGTLISESKFKDAFHYHNTGRTFPKIGLSRTHDPDYVAKGLKFMKYYEQTKP